MKDKNILIPAGTVIYIVISGIDKFVYSIPNAAYISAAITGIALIFDRIILAAIKASGKSKFTQGFGAFQTSKNLSYCRRQ